MVEILVLQEIQNAKNVVLSIYVKIINKKWKKPIPNWKTIQPQSIELFGDRYMKHLKI